MTPIPFKGQISQNGQKTGTFNARTEPLVLTYLCSIGRDMTTHPDYDSVKFSYDKDFEQVKVEGTCKKGSINTAINGALRSVGFDIYPKPEDTFSITTDSLETSLSYNNGEVTLTMSELDDVPRTPEQQVECTNQTANIVRILAGSIINKLNKKE